MRADEKRRTDATRARRREGKKYDGATIHERARERDREGGTGSRSRGSLAHPCRPPVRVSPSVPPSLPLMCKATPRNAGSTNGGYNRLQYSEVRSRACMHAHVTCCFQHQTVTRAIFRSGYGDERSLFASVCTCRLRCSTCERGEERE